jgi:hypothetical protein
LSNIVTILEKESTRRVKIITEIRNGYKILSKYLLSFRKSISVQNIRLQHEMAALENFEWRQGGATDAEKSKSAKVNVEFLCCLSKYLPKSITSIGHTRT